MTTRMKFLLLALALATGVLLALAGCSSEAPTKGTAADAPKIATDGAPGSPSGSQAGGSTSIGGGEGSDQIAAPNILDILVPGATETPGDSIPGDSIPPDTTGWDTTVVDTGDTTTPPPPPPDTTWDTIIVVDTSDTGTTPPPPDTSGLGEITGLVYLTFTAYNYDSLGSKFPLFVRTEFETEQLEACPHARIASNWTTSDSLVSYDLLGIPPYECFAYQPGPATLVTNFGFKTRVATVIIVYRGQADTYRVSEGANGQTVVEVVRQTFTRLK